MTLKEVSEYFDITIDTVRNWIKTGKISAKVIDGVPNIVANEISHIQYLIDNDGLLSIRRNKSKKKSNFIPKAYIATSSPNYQHICELISLLEYRDIDILEVIDHYAYKLMENAGLTDDIIDSLSFKKSISEDLSGYLNKIELSNISGEDTLGMLYISLRKMQDKKASGSYYTPFFAVDSLLSNIDFKNKTIYDPACGTGNFLLRIPEAIPLSSIYGSDIDEFAVKISRINLAIKYKIQTDAELDTLLSNIVVKDFLTSEISCTYDVIIGNPPWGSSFDKSRIKELKQEFNCITGSGKPESAALFIEKSLKFLSDEGMISFLLPESLLSADMHKALRKIILEKAHVTSLSYLGDIFDSVQCPCVVLSISYKNQNFVSVSFNKKEKNERIVPIRQFNASCNRITAASFHILADNKEYAIIEKILSAPHFTLKDKADFALGIVTGSNATMLKSERTDGYEGILKGSDIHKYYFNEPGSFIKFEPEHFQQVAPEHYYRAKEKLFYRFIANEPIFAYDNTGMLSLNSANILIPHVEGYSSAYIMAILNSDVISFYYKHTFKNMKVLRSAIESLPIAKCDEETMEKIDSLAMQIVKKGANIEILQHLKLQIYSLYGISIGEF